MIPEFESFKDQIFSAFISKTADLNGALDESGLKEEDLPYIVPYYKRQYGKLIEFIRNDTTSQFDKQFTIHPKTYDIALMYFLSGNTSLCKTYADSSITLLKEKLKEISNDERYYATLGKCYALIGDDKEAISCGKKAVELKPITLDAWQGIVKEQDLMEIYIFLGDYDMALDKIELLLSTPSELSVGELMIDPIFDNLRSLPRFQKIIDSVQKQLKEK
jgi:tetratricopeptide (TPR) repeat protein